MARRGSCRISSRARLGRTGLIHERITDALLARPDLDITNVEWVALGGRKSRLYLRIEGRLYKIDIHAPETLRNPDKKFRRLHRGVLHLLKNAIAVAEEGLCNVGEILVAFLVTSDENVTVGSPSRA